MYKVIIIIFASGITRVYVCETKIYTRDNGRNVCESVCVCVWLKIHPKYKLDR